MIRQLWCFNLAFCVLLVFSGHADAKGTVLELPPDDPCYSLSFRKATFTPAPYKYEFAGTCNLVHTRAAFPITVSWTAVGTYDPATGATTEVITVPPPLISEPSRPYGEFRASLHCVNDPWRAKAPQCDLLSAVSNPPPTAFGPTYKWNNYSGDYFRYVLNSILDVIKGSRLPYTATMGLDDAINAAKKAHDSMPVQPVPGLTQSLQEFQVPTVLAPTAGLKVSERTPMSIKLAPPNGWNVTSYIVTLQKKDPKGNWIANSTLPVGAVQAQSAGGYTGFGAGAPPAFLSLPGAWRLNAQASYPKVSGWSNWTEFTVSPQTVIPFKYGQPSTPFTIK